MLKDVWLVSGAGRLGGDTSFAIAVGNAVGLRIDAVLHEQHNEAVKHTWSNQFKRMN
jgi:hypothetical protein